MFTGAKVAILIYIFFGRKAFLDIIFQNVAAQPNKPGKKIC
jgi:hypothetical protein